jgi:hypothetical protein
VDSKSFLFSVRHPQYNVVRNRATGTVLTRPGCSSATQCPAPGTKSTFSSLVHVLRMSSNAPGYVPQMTSHRAWLV